MNTSCLITGGTALTRSRGISLSSCAVTLEYLARAAEHLSLLVAGRNAQFAVVYINRKSRLCFDLCSKYAS
jgi:hypothetical protein